MQRIFAVLALIAAVSIVIGSLIHPLYVAPVLPDIPDIWLHVTAYFTVAFLNAVAVNSVYRALFTTIALIGLGGFIEAIQFSLSGRDGLWSEAFGDGAGAIGGYLLGRFLLCRMTSSRSK